MLKSIPCIEYIIHKINFFLTGLRTHKKKKDTLEDVVLTARGTFSATLCICYH